MTTRELVEKLVAAVDSPNFGPREETLLAEARYWLAETDEDGESNHSTLYSPAYVAARMAEARRGALREAAEEVSRQLPELHHARGSCVHAIWALADAPAQPHGTDPGEFMVQLDIYPGVKP